VELVQLLAESQRHLKIAELLVEDALKVEPQDRDLKRLKERLEDEIDAASDAGVEMLPVNGTARDYAANAYKALEG
jgi:hypothetical protein